MGRRRIGFIGLGLGFFWILAYYPIFFASKTDCKLHLRHAGAADIGSSPLGGSVKAAEAFSGAWKAEDAFFRFGVRASTSTSQICVRMTLKPQSDGYTGYCCG